MALQFGGELCARRGSKPAGHGAAPGKERAEELLVLWAGNCPDASLQRACLEP